MTGALGWLRDNLLSTPFNIALTILIVLLFAWAIPELVKFLLIDAVWSGSDRDACLESVQHREIGACWPFVWERLPYFIYGSYPISERWRVDVSFAMLAIGVVWLLWLKRAAPRSRRHLFLRRIAGRVVHPADGLDSDRPCSRSTPCCGAACW